MKNVAKSTIAPMVIVFIAVRNWRLQTMEDMAKGEVGMSSTRILKRVEVQTTLGTWFPLVQIAT